MSNKRITSIRLDAKMYEDEDQDHIVEDVRVKRVRHSHDEAKITNLMPTTLHNSLASHSLLFLIAFLAIAPLVAAAQSAVPVSGQPVSGTWTGILVSASCKPEEILKDTSSCFTGGSEARPSLFDDTNGKVYVLEPRQAVTARLGELVTVNGALAGVTIQNASVELLPLGLAVGQKAPDFAIPDQFGQVQTLETLRGPNGTVLLFFRSADW